MESASKDVLFTIAMNLDLPSLLRWCESNSRINKNVCLNSDVWRSKLLKDFPSEYPGFQKYGLNRSLRETYVFLYQLSYIKKLLNTNESLYDIFVKRTLNLSNKRLSKVPAFDLPNLEILDLSNNNLRNVPAFNLPNLQYLHLNHNQLEKIPGFNLPNLAYLYINNNQLRDIPPLVLPSLLIISVYDNKFNDEEYRKIYKKFPNKVR